jgi:two-component system sensor histidine kinase MtrB
MRRPGLRARVTLMFSAGALLLSTALAVSTYELTARYLLGERERTAVRGAYFDAAVVRQGLSGDDPDLVAVLRALDTGLGRRPLIRRQGVWFARSADTRLTEAVPAALQAIVVKGQPAVQRIRVAGQPAVVVGVPLVRDGEDFYEIQSLTEVQQTLRTLAGILSVVAVAATIAAASLSRWTSRRVLRPLRDVAQAATRFSSGNLSVRMEPTQDPDLSQLSEAFNTMVAEVSLRIDRDQRFAADVSHELRSPLQTLTAASSVLLGRADNLDERSAAAARMVAQESARFTVLVQDLLVLARAETVATLTPTVVPDLLRKACRRAGVSEGILHVGAEVGEWPLDPPRIEQVIVNLLDNARKHGGGAVEVTAEVVSGALALTVDDAGPGVPHDERDMIFDRFSRGRSAHSRGDHDGTGLGLALVAQHVAMHAGHVELLDRPGGGCRIRVVLPNGDR